LIQPKVAQNVAISLGSTTIYSNNHKYFKTCPIGKNHPICGQFSETFLASILDSGNTARGINFAMFLIDTIGHTAYFETQCDLNTNNFD
jgi:hypothetical protein